MLRTTLRIIALYAAIALILFLPVLPQFSTAILGGPVAAVDGWQQVWHVWWAQRAVFSGESPVFTPLLYHPHGVSLAIHPLSLSNGLLALPISSLFGPTAGYNAVTYASFVLAGLAAYALALQNGARAGAAALAAAIFAFSPYHTAKMFDGQLELVALQWLGFVALFLLRVVQRWSFIDILVCGVLFAVVGYTSLYYLLYSVFLAALIVGLWMPWRAGLAMVGRRLLLLAVIPLIGVALLLPLVLPLLADLPSIARSTDEDRIAADYLVLRSANLVDFVLPSALHPLWGPQADAIAAQLHPGIAARTITLGITAIVLALVGVWTDWQRSWRWLLIALCAVLLALGPQLTIGTWDTGWPLPYRALLGIPGMNISRRPGHFVVIVTLALVPLAAFGIQALQQRFARPRLVLGIVAILLLIEYLPAPMPVQQRSVHPIYHELHDRPGALLVIPEISKGSRSLQRQLDHGRPILGGFMARTPAYPFARETPGVRQLWALRPELREVGEPIATLGPLALRAYGISEVVVEWNDLTIEERVQVAAALNQVLPGVRPWFNDDDVSVYTVPDVPLRPFVAFGEGWYRAEGDGTRSWRWMGADAELVLVNPLPTPQPVTLQLAGESYLGPRPVALTLNGQAITVWQLNVAEGRGSMQLRLLLPPGEQRLALHATTSPENSGDGRGDLSIVLHTLRLEVAASGM
jgi:hypothetical protein